MVVVRCQQTSHLTFQKHYSIQHSGKYLGQNTGVLQNYKVHNNTYQ